MYTYHHIPIPWPSDTQCVVFNGEYKGVGKSGFSGPNAQLANTPSIPV